MPTIAANDSQRRNWNDGTGRKWIRHEAALEASHAAIAALLLDAAAAAAGESVLEVGCGTGTLLERLAEAVGPAGQVVGLDIAATMLAVARERAPGSVRLIEADAQNAALGGPYDLMVSRFGVMFFDDPVAALHNLRSALRPEGRLCFVCWAALEQNPHWRDALAIAVRHLGAPAASDPQAPGPFAFGDPARVRRLLEAAGFSRVTLRTEHPPLATLAADDAVELAMSMGPAGALISERAPDVATSMAIRADILQVLAPHLASVHLVTARL